MADNSMVMDLHDFEISCLGVLAMFGLLVFVAAMPEHVDRRHRAGLVRAVLVVSVVFMMIGVGTSYDYFRKGGTYHARVVN